VTCWQQVGSFPVYGKLQGNMCNGFWALLTLLACLGMVIRMSADITFHCCILFSIWLSCSCLYKPQFIYIYLIFCISIHWCYRCKATSASQFCGDINEDYVW